MCRCREDHHPVVRPYRSIYKKTRANNGTHEASPATPTIIYSKPPRTHLRVGCILKILWDALTILLSLTASPYATHASIRDRCFHHILDEMCSKKGLLPSVMFLNTRLNIITMCINIWFALDILLNFFHEIQRRSMVTTQGRTIQRSYLKTWFLIDAISIMPWETILVQPSLIRQHKENVFLKILGVARAIPFVKRRWYYVSACCRLLKYAGWKPMRIIKYIPQYIVFFHEMKVVLIFRALRQIHWIQRLVRSVEALFITE